MTNPRATADPGKFILGRGLYTSLLAAGAYADERVFRIEPSPLPLGMILGVNLIFAAFFLGFHWMMRQFTQFPHGPSPWMVYGAPLGVGLLTCGLFTGFVYYLFAKERHRGPWLAVDKASGQVELPRENVRFERGEVVYLQYITTKRLDWGTVWNNARLTELNLLTCCDGIRKRWPLLRSTLDHGPFDRLLQSLLEHTDLPVVRVEDEWLGWDVTETPYSRQRRDG